MTRAYRLILNLCCLLLCWLFYSCDNQPTEGGSNAPGMPNWNEPQYDWIASLHQHCQDYYIGKWSWTPKFWLQVVGSSPDGEQLLLNTGERLVLFDTKPHTAYTIFTGAIENARWSRDGKHIAIIRAFANSLQEKIAVYTVMTDTWHNIPVPDSSNMTPYPYWAPLDTAIIVGLLFPSDIHSHAYTIGIDSPYTVRYFPWPKNAGELHFHDSTTYALVMDHSDPQTGKASVTLRFGMTNDTTTWKSYLLSHVIQRNDSRLSPDGNWLAFTMSADLDGTRFQGNPTSILALGIIDLRPGSPTQYQLYRVFPDYPNLVCNCAGGMPGMAWSGDGRYIYHEQVRISDSTMQIVRREVETGKTEEITNFLTPP